MIRVKLHRLRLIVEIGKRLAMTPHCHTVKPRIEAVLLSSPAKRERKGPAADRGGEVRASCWQSALIYPMSLRAIGPFLLPLCGRRHFWSKAAIDMGPGGET